MQLLDSDHVRERDKALLRSILVGGVWNGFLLQKVKGQRVLCRFCGVLTVMVTFFGSALFHLWLRLVNTLSSMISCSWISRLGLIVCFGMVGCLFFLGFNGGFPWAESPREGACNLLEYALGRYSSDALTEWQLSVGFDAEGAARNVAAEPDVWTDGSLVEDKVSGASSAGAGCFTFRCSRLWATWRWGHLDDDVGEGAVVSACRGFCSVRGPLQSVQRAEFWGVIFALQADDGVHLGVDNLGVVRHVGRLLDGKTAFRPAELVKDGDPILLIERMLRLRGLDTVRISTVRGHADEALVRTGGARDLGRLGMRLLILVVGGCLGGLLMLGVIILGVVFVGARLFSVCIVFFCHCQAVVNHDGVAGTALDPTVRSVGGAPKRRRVVQAVRDRAFLPGPSGIWDGEWGVVAATLFYLS